MEWYSVFLTFSQVHEKFYNYEYMFWITVMIFGGSFLTFQRWKIWHNVFAGNKLERMGKLRSGVSLQAMSAIKVGQQAQIPHFVMRVMIQTKCGRRSPLVPLIFS